VATIARRRSWLIAALSIALVIALLLGGRGAMRLYFRMTRPPPPPRQTDVSAIADWMTVPAIGRAYRVPEPEIYRALGVSPERRTYTLADLASETGRSSDDVVAIVRDTVTAWQASHPAPSRPEPPKPEGATTSEPEARAPPLQQTLVGSHHVMGQPAS
jgi:hypothetical protein